MSPLSLPSGRRLIVEPGNAFGSLRRKLRGLKPGRYYWSVQTIDASFEGSPFATEQTFTIGVPKVEFISTEARAGSLLLKVQSDSPTVLILEQSTDLKTWSPLQTNSLPQGETTLTVPAIESAAFYRLSPPSEAIAESND